MSAAVPQLLLACRKSSVLKRRGAVIVFTALLIAILLGFCAFAVDLGYIANTKAELVRAVDAGALAGVGVLPQGLAATTPVVRQYVKANIVGAREVKDEEIQVQVGHWDSQARQFTPSDERPSALRVIVDRPRQPMFFGKIFGKDEFRSDGRSHRAISAPRHHADARLLGLDERRQHVRGLEHAGLGARDRQPATDPQRVGQPHVRQHDVQRRDSSATTN